MSSTKNSPNGNIHNILQKLNKLEFWNIINKNFKNEAILSPSKSFTIILPNALGIKKLSLLPKDKAKYIIKSHFILNNFTEFSAKNRNLKTANNTTDLVFKSSSGKNYMLEDCNGNPVTVTHISASGLPSFKTFNYSVFKIVNANEYINSYNAKSKAVSGGAPNNNNNGNDSINHCRLRYHLDALAEFKSFLFNQKNKINPYNPLCAGLLKYLDHNKHETECKKVALLLSNCSFGLFYILVQPFKTRGDPIISDEIIKNWCGMKYYPEDICKFYDNFAKKYAPEIYDSSNILDQVNVIRNDFDLSGNYKDYILESYDKFLNNILPDGYKNLFTKEQKYYFDELKFKLCNIYCNMTQNSYDEFTLFYNMNMIELIFPCNDEIGEANFTNKTYEEFITRNELIAPTGIYKFVHSTDFLSVYYDQNILKTKDIITDNVNEITLDSKNVFNSELCRLHILEQDKEKIKCIYEYNKNCYA